MTKRLFLIPALLLLLLTGCKKFAGLGLQEDTQHHPYLLDPHVKMNAWQYLRHRSGGDNAPGADSVLYLMYQAVLYSGIDTNEYTKTDRTFIFLHNLAVINYTATVPIVPSSACYWGYYTVTDPTGDTIRPAKSWSDYTPAQVKSWLQYLIVQGTYSYDNLTPTEVTVNTLLPPGTDTLNPKSIMVLERVKTSDGKIRINNFVNSSNYVEVRTGGILTTNGPVHVVDQCVVYKLL
ncbi:fasciclin domain-containing protein [Flavitalea sp. BT771]|uniref:fasciclin domain-containing protein n=1 Tax=Flavitalea sp. BT771 TaxID=3063329 RepID=UPI0026E19C90|nr:fasciclin domain-containing protein [Flavitalea sp. BT771]MDO6435250.1 fasciclin domain-containing protein [Flavitalea sp. BT771]MDV6224045.1 fasciclin domain-containing protein [Flavitalea sp. BT771]